jgi:hypothetical protein
MLRTFFLKREFSNSNLAITEAISPSRDNGGIKRIK